MPQVTGRIVGKTHEREPLISLRLRAPGFGARMPGTSVPGVLVDSGFNDSLIVPEKAIQPLLPLLPLPYKRRIFYTETEWEWYDTYSIEVYWMGQWEEHRVFARRDVTPMIGMHFLEGCTIDFRAGKVVISQS